MQDRNGFIGSLFDFSFSNFITTRIIAVLYGIGLLVAVIYTIFVVAWGFTLDTWLGILLLLLSPVVFIIFAILARVYMEIIIVVFRIAEYVRDIANEKGLSDAGGPSPQGPPPSTPRGPASDFDQGPTSTGDVNR